MWKILGYEAIFVEVVEAYAPQKALWEWQEHAGREESWLSDSQK